MRAGAAVLASALLALGPGVLAPPAHALTPPVIDPSLLPEPARPAPPRPTVQRGACAIGKAAKTAGAQPSPAKALGIDTLWSMTRGEGQRIAVIDTGVAPHHRLGHLEGVGDYVGSGDGTQDCDGHGTVVAGLIAAAPDTADGFSGVAPAATVLSVRQSSTRFGPADEPATAGFGDVDTMARAVRVAADSGATVINISVVACAEGDLADRALGAALAYAVDTKDVVVVTAAGNVGGPVRCPAQPEGQAAQWDTATVAVSPAWYDDYVLTVGSVAADGAPSAFTLAGPWVDVAAPGEALLSLNASGSGLVDALPSAAGDAPISGTSYAAPIVSGLAALIRSRFPELTARQVMQRIENTTHRRALGWDPAVGNGLIDPVAAMSSEAPSTLPERPVPGPLVETGSEASAGDQARTVAVAGAAVCVAVGIAAWGSSAMRRRGRRDVSLH
ncbi:type VII secretion-associated serine protease mycosin [Mycobacterium sp. ACS4331]|uniref:type VII secretion-associated serine protease mycosin n=1 Tax=Mycobacterium sp. ACS4331 TaxID=1834121 RepID=UPI0007FB7E15|nr:type VII secretion-associated serine protease mycosin [Mycobacterium sp. ACS4331]OBF16161.1 type VII secretion-associated serine protease mycosin [Mycobacterium sp. ACS4331]